MKLCHKCKTEWKNISQPGTKETCGKCGEDLHVCLNCSFCDEHKPSGCTEPDADPVLNKERFNFCDYFRFCDNLPGKPPAGGREEQKNAFNKLFKK